MWNQINYEFENYSKLDKSLSSLSAATAAFSSLCSVVGVHTTTSLENTITFILDLLRSTHETLKTARSDISSADWILLTSLKNNNNDTLFCRAIQRKIPALILDPHYKPGDNLENNNNNNTTPPILHLIQLVILSVIQHFRENNIQVLFFPILRALASLTTINSSTLIPLTNCNTSTLNAYFNNDSPRRSLLLQRMLPLILDIYDVILCIDNLFSANSNCCSEQFLLDVLRILAPGGAQLDELEEWTEASSNPQASWDIFNTMRSNALQAILSQQHILPCISSTLQLRLIQTMSCRTDTKPFRFFLFGLIVQAMDYSRNNHVSNNNNNNKLKTDTCTTTETSTSSGTSSTNRCVGSVSQAARFDLLRWFLEATSSTFTSSQRATIIRSVLLTLTAGHVPASAFVSGYATLEPLLWPRKNSWNSAPSIQYQLQQTVDETVLLTFLECKGYRVISQLSSISRCPMSCVTLSFRLLLAIFRQSTNVPGRPNAMEGNAETLIRHFEWYILASSSCLYLLASLMGLRRNLAFQLLANWPSSLSDLIDRICFCLTDGNENIDIFPSGGQPSIHRHRFFRTQSLNRIEIVFDMLVYCLMRAREKHLINGYLQLLTDSSEIFARDDTITGFQTRPLINRIGTLLLETDKVDIVQNCMTWLDRAVTAFWRKSTKTSATAILKQNKDDSYAQINDIFEAFIQRLRLKNKFYPEHTFSFNETDDWDIKPILKFSTLNDNCRLRNSQWHSIVTRISLSHGTFFPQLILIPLYVLRAKTDSVINIARQETRRQTESTTDESNDVANKNTIGGGVINPCEEGFIGKTTAPDDSTSNQNNTGATNISGQRYWETSKQALAMLLNDIRLPLFYILKCFGAAFHSRATNLSDELRLFALSHILLSFEAVYHLTRESAKKLFWELRELSLGFVGTFLVALAPFVCDLASVSVFLKLRGFDLLLCVLDLLSFTGPLSGRGRPEILKTILVDELADLSTRVLELVQRCFELCSFDSVHVLSYINEKAVYDMFKHANSQMRLQLLQTVSTPLLGASKHALVISFTPWDCIIQNLTDPTIEDPCLKEDILSVIFDLLANEKKVFYTTKSADRSFARMLQENEAMRSLQPCCDFDVCSLPKNLIKTTTTTNNTSNNSPFQQILRNNNEQPAACNNIGNRETAQEYTCPHCKSLRPKLVVNFWAHNPQAVLIIQKLSSYLISDDKFVIEWLLDTTGNHNCVNHNTSLDDGSKSLLVSTPSTTIDDDETYLLQCLGADYKTFKDEAHYSLSPSSIFHCSSNCIESIGFTHNSYGISKSQVEMDSVGQTASLERLPYQCLKIIQSFFGDTNCYKKIT